MHTSYRYTLLTMAKYLSLVYVCLGYMHTSYRYTVLTMAKYLSLVYVCLGYMHTSYRYSLLNIIWGIINDEAVLI